MATKHVLNDPKKLVVDALTGLAYLNNEVFVDLENTTVHLRDPAKDNVSLICGGGSGHEPSHGAMVGKGMLTAAVAGQVFASPNSKQVEAAIDRLTSSTKATLVIVKNYTGDALQFGLAKERWQAKHPSETSRLRMMIVGDDVAVPRSQNEITGRRGLAGTCLVYKIAGALASQGGSIDDVEHIANIVAQNTGTLGIGLEHCHVPGTKASDESYLGKNEVEIGMGIHNEPGINKKSPIPSTESLVDELLSTITNTEDKERSYVPFQNDGKDEVVLLVNNLGGLAEIELSVVTKEACAWLEKKPIKCERVLAGSFMSSLNLPGFSLSLLLLPREPVKPDNFESRSSFDKSLILECLDAPTSAPGWRWHAKSEPNLKVEEIKPAKQTKDDSKPVNATDSKKFTQALEAGLKALVKAETDITHYDTVAGDGDAGLTLKAGAEAILSSIQKGDVSDTNVVQAVVAMSDIVARDMGGTSGGLYSIFLAGLARGLRQAAEQTSTDKATTQVWSRALELALNTLYDYTRARPPSRTLIDPLSSFIITLAADPEKNVRKAFDEAFEAAEATKTLEAKAGRAAYVDKSAIEKANVPDAGAWGVKCFLEGVKGVIL